MDIFTDYEGNVVQCASMEEANRRGLNVNCINCTNCVGCFNCTDCNKCTDCTHCTNCTFSKNCITCRNSYNCAFCAECNDCSECNSCHSCSNCHRCMYSTDNKFCNNCNNCHNCNNCSWCNGARNCTSQPVQILTDNWTVTVRNNKTMKIGCKDFSIRTWRAMKIEDIQNLDDRAVEFFDKWGDVIEALVDVVEGK